MKTKKRNGFKREITKFIGLSSVWVGALVLSPMSFANVSTMDEGSGHSGGGSGIILKDGSVHLVDMIKNSIDPTQIASEEEITKMFFEKNRFVKTLAQKDEHFFDCAINKISATNIFHKNIWIASLKSSRVLKVELPLFSIKNSVESSNALESQAFPILADASSSINVKQVALASYNRGDLWVQKRFYEKMSENEQCALSMHEAIRHLNFYYNLKTPFSTSDIETLTKGVMGGDEEQISRLDKIKAVENLEAIRKVIEPVLSIGLNNELPNYEKRTEISDQARNLIYETLRVDLNPSSNSLSTLADSALKLAQVVGDYRFDHWQKLNEQQNKDISEMQWKLLNAADELLTTSTVRVGYEVLLTDNFFNRIFVNASLTTPLTGFKYYDVKKQKVVKRLFN